MRTLRQAIFGALVLGSLFAVPASAQVCGTSMTTPLIAGQNMTAGTVSVYNDATNIYVRYTLDSPWLIGDAHVAVATTLAGIPQTKTGNPIPGRFAYSATFDPELLTYTFAVPMAGNYSTGQMLFVAAHAVVQAPRAYGGSQTAWGSGPDFPGNNWGMYLNYRVQSCGGFPE